MNREQVKVLATEGQGWLIVNNHKVKIEANQEITVKL
jgi:hypothetical protein